MFTVLEVSLFAVCLMLGARGYKNMDTFLRLVYIQVMVWVLFYGFNLLQYSFGLFKDILPSNHLVMNFSMLAECSLLVGAVVSYHREKWIKLVSTGMFVVFVSVWTTQGILQGFWDYFNYADVVECVIISLLYASVLFSVFTERKAGWWKLPEFFVCLGLMVYFACSVPYITMIHYIQEKDPELNVFLFRLINDALAMFRYTCMAIAFGMVTFDKNIANGQLAT